VCILEEEVLNVEQRSNMTQKLSVPQMSIGKWVITFLILSVPLVNIIMLFVWAFDGMSERRNFSRAYLIIFAIMFILAIIFAIIAYVISASIGSQMFG